MRPSLAIDRGSTRRLAAAMALVMMIASLPSVGVIVISERCGPTISMDICHPLQSLDSSPTIVAIAPAHPEIRAKILSRETIPQFVPIPKSKFAEAPDPPPPKLFS